MNCYTILNGPSSIPWRGAKFNGPVFGCNFAYRHFKLDHLFAVDQQMIERIDQDDPKHMWLYTKHRNRVPRGWRGKVIPGLDSGSFAFERALIMYPECQHIVIGADGILEQDHKTVYDYDWHTKSNRNYSHNLHRQTFLKVIKQYEPNYWFVSDTPDKDIRTISFEDISRKTGMELDAQRPEPTST